MPKTKTKREAWTIVMDPVLKRATQIQAATAGRDSSDLINEAMAAALTKKSLRQARQELKNA